MIGGLLLESNSFSPFVASLADFRNGIYFVEGETILEHFSQRTSELRGFLDGLQAERWQIIPTVASQAVSSGPLARDAYDWFLGRWLEAVRQPPGPAAIFLALHGATITEHGDDGCGDILAALREAAGSHVFIGASCDLHANLTRKMVQAANVLYGYHTYPHIDEYATGLRVGQLARAYLEEDVRPTMALCQVPMLLAPGNQYTERGPNAELLAAVRRLEAEPGVLGASFFEPQAWLDLADVGAAALVITRQDTAAAQEAARRLARMLWARRHQFVLPQPTAAEAVDEALRTASGPVVLSDLGDGAGGGAAGDSTVLLREFLRVSHTHPGPFMLTLTDPEAVAAAAVRGVGARLTLSVGARLSPDYFEPIDVTGTVEYVGRPTYKPYHVETPMGQTAVLAVAGIHIVMTDKPIFVYSPDVYSAVGLDPFKAKIVVVKSGAQFRQHWESTARKILLVNTPGPTCNDLLSLPFRRLTHPMFPWEDWDWQA
jgi:microcystin degradation protein MlrC